MILELINMVCFVFLATYALRFLLEAVLLVVGVLCSVELTCRKKRLVKRP